MSVELPVVARHPNRQPFRGALTLVDVASDRAPSGARGHRVILTRTAAETAIPSLLGMGLGYRPALDGHDARRKVGIITGADIVGRSLEVRGYLFARDFPDVVRDLRAGGKTVLGMSYEIADARVADVKASIWQLTEVTFTGAAILRRNKAAYPDTWIEGGRLVRVAARFARYESMQACFADRDRLITRLSVYADARAVAGDPEAFIRALARHWATDPKYAEKLLGLYRATASMPSSVLQPEFLTTETRRHGDTPQESPCLCASVVKQKKGGIMGFLALLLRGISFVPAIVHGIEALFGSKKGADKKESALAFIAAALSMAESVANKDIVDESKFRDGLSKVIDGVVDCLNASAWAKKA